MNLNTKFIIGFLIAGLIPLLILALIAIDQQTNIITNYAIRDAEDVAKTIEGSISIEPKQPGRKSLFDQPLKLQIFLNDFLRDTGKDFVVVGLDKRILADAVPENVGTVFTYDLNNEIGLTLQDGKPRTFKEISEDYPEGIDLMVVPIKQEGKIIGATFLQEEEEEEEEAKEEAKELIEIISALISYKPPLMSQSIFEQPKILQILIEKNIPQIAHKDFVVVGLDKRILADAVPENVGTVFTYDLNNEIGLTLQDGKPRTFKEISEDYPEGIDLMVVPIKQEGKIIGATITEFEVSATETREDEIEEAKTITESLAIFISERLPLDEPKPVYKESEQLQNYVASLSKDTERDIVVMDLDKTVLADTVPENIGIEFTADTGNEIRQTMQDGKPRTFKEISEDYPKGIDLNVVPIKNLAGEITGAVVTSYTPLFQESVQQFEVIVVIAVVIGILIILGVSFFIARSITKPVKILTEAADKLSKGGEKFQELTVTGTDEIGKLTESFNRMGRQVSILMKEVGKKWDKEDNKKK